MPITYQCDQCGKTATTMVGWYLVRVALLYNDPQTTAPYAPTTEETKPDYIFDTQGHRSQWLAAKGLA